MKNKVDKDSKLDIKYQINYFQQVKTTVQLSKQKQQQRQFNDIAFLNVQENHNPINKNNGDNNGYGRRQRGRRRDYDDDENNNIYSETEIDSEENYERNEDAESGVDNQGDQQLGLENCSDNQNDIILNEQIENQNDQNTQIGNEQILIQEEKKQITQNQNNKQKQEDKLINNLKQKIIFCQFKKQQILNILQKNDQDLANFKPIAAADFTDEGKESEIQMNFDSEFSNQRFNTICFLKRCFQQYCQIDLEYQEKLKNVFSSSLEQGFNNSKIVRKNFYPFYFSKQEMQSLNYYEFSSNYVQKPGAFKKNLQQKLSDESRLNFINLILNKDVNKKLIEKIEDNELILDLIPSTIFTKVIDLNLSTNNLLSILLAANCLASFSNFNILNIEGDNSILDQKNKINYHHYLRLLFDSILQQRALQSLSLLNIPLFSQSFLNSLQSIDLGQCYINSLQLESYISEKDQQYLLKLISCLPYIKSFLCQGLILDTKEKIQILNSILKKITCAKIVILQLPDNFDFLFEFENIKFLEIHISIGKQRLSNRKLENFQKSLSTSKNLKFLNFRFFFSIKKKKNQKKKEQVEENEQESLNEGDEIDEQQNQNNMDSDNQSSDEEENEYSDDEEEQQVNSEEEDYDDDNYHIKSRQYNRNRRQHSSNQEDEYNEGQVLCDDEMNAQQSYKFFDYLNDLEDLQDIEFEIELSQKLTESFISFLEQSKNLTKIVLKSNEDFTDNNYFQAFLLEFKQLNSAKVDFKNIYEIISKKQNLQKFDLNLKNYQIYYKKISEKDSNYSLNIQQKNLPLNSIGFNPIIFQLPNLIEFSYKASNENMDYYQQLSWLLSSLQKSENLQKIKIEIENKYRDERSSKQKKQNSIEDLKRQNFNSKSHTLFSNLNNLGQLFKIELSIDLDEIILNSLSEFIQNNKFIKYFYLERACSFWNYSSVNLKGFSKFIQSLSTSSSLKLISLSKLIDRYEISKIQQQQLWDEIVNPLVNLIEKKDRNLATIEFFQDLNEDQIQSILKSLLESTSPINIKFNYQITNKVRRSENLQKLYDQYKDKNTLKQDKINQADDNDW
ncbi:hypothetical protein ABPG72_002776 [Tetrahymena utriculariae]